MEKEQGGVMAEQVAEMTPEQPTLRKYREKVKARYADADPQSDEDWMELEDKYADDVEGELSKYKDADMTLQEVMTAYPEMGVMLHDIVVNKLPFRVAIAKNFSQEDLIPSEGDEDYPDYNTVLEDNRKKTQERADIDSQIEANMVKSLENIDAYAQTKGYSDEQKQSLTDFINDTFQDLLMKKIDEKVLMAFDKAMNYDKDIEDAKVQAEISGKNAAIDLKKASAEGATDGVPNPGAKGGVVIKDVKPSEASQLLKGVGKRKGI